MDLLVDSNVILDVLTKDLKWFQWSSEKLAQSADHYRLLINCIIYSEISIRFSQIEDLEEALPPSWFFRASIPWEAVFLAGKVFLNYKKQGGIKKTPLPDFFIGAHAAILNIPLLTRDSKKYSFYFPKLKLISP